LVSRNSNLFNIDDGHTRGAVGLAFLSFKSK
jgi:hypothetical protein